MNLKTLDTVIALITVILLLSLIVQSVQSLIKKWFKLKSKSIQTSLVDLFNFIDTKALAGVESSRLVEEIKKQFQSLGRVSLFNNPMMDSIAKEDLLKILDKIKVDGAEAPKLAELKQQVDTWFETVMQSFEERYTRHMKTVAICISIVVVIVLNASFFEVYHNISTNDVMRDAIVAKHAEIESKLKQLANDQNGEVTQAEVDKAVQDLKDLTDETSVFGFTPLKAGDVSNFFSATGSWTGASRSARFGYLFKQAAGWAIMVMLLSVGAPFWQDTLESLFGIKNLIRKRSDTKNVEDVGGQAKP